MYSKHGAFVFRDRPEQGDFDCNADCFSVFYSISANFGIFLRKILKILRITEKYRNFGKILGGKLKNSALNI